MKRYSKAGNGWNEDPNGKFMMKGGKMIPFKNGDDGDDDDEGGVEIEVKKKSEVTVDDFQKSLDQLEAIAKADDPESRKEELLAKASNGEELTSGERDELFKALGSGDDFVDDDPEIIKSVEAAMDPEANGESFQKALDVSEYLEAQHTALTSSLTELAKAMDASDQRQHEFNLVFAKAFHQVGELVKGMSERLGVIERQPARAPKSKGIPAASAGVVQKSFANAEAPTGDLSKGEILDGLENMMRKSVDAGSNGMARCGEDILQATAKFEQTNQISKALLGEVTEFQKSQAH